MQPRGWDLCSPQGSWAEVWVLGIPRSVASLKQSCPTHSQPFDKHHDLKTFHQDGHWSLLQLRGCLPTLPAPRPPCGPRSQARLSPAGISVLLPRPLSATAPHLLWGHDSSSSPSSTAHQLCGPEPSLLNWKKRTFTFQLLRRLNEQRKGTQPAQLSPWTCS